jgi:hypothetical protein
VRQWLISSAIVVGSLIWGAVPAEAGDPTPTNAEVAEKTTDELTQAIEAKLPKPSAAQSKLYLRAQGNSTFLPSFQDVLAPSLIQLGWDVWILDAGEDPAEGGLLLEYEVLQASLRYPSQSHGFLGLGTPMVKRRMDLQVQARLDEPSTGRLYWLETPEAHYRDSFPLPQKASVESGQPSWMGTKIPIESGTESRAGFWERIAILGLIGGVVALYISGAG